MRAASNWPKVRKDKSRGDYLIDCGKVDGKRRVFRRKTVGEAVVKADELRKERERLGELAFALTAEQRIEAAQCYQLLSASECEIPLCQIVRERIDDIKAPVNIPVSVAIAFSRRLDDMERRGLRDRSIESTRSRLNSYIGFCGCHANVRDVDVLQIEVFLKRLPPGSQVAYIRELKAFFNFCMKRGYCAANPLDGIEPPHIDRGVPGFMSVADVSRFMQELYTHEKYYRYYCHAALGFFSGLRPEELCRMTWSNVNLGERIITISPEIAKTRRVRHVTISDNLLAWLTTTYAGPLTHENFDHVRRTICKKLDIKWPHDCMRHTFATMHLAHHRDAALTAHELGHTQGVDLLYTHYRGLCSKKDAEAFWNILPYYQQGESNDHSSSEETNP